MLLEIGILLKGPQRIQIFMSWVAHDRILNNYQRRKWGLGIDTTCTCCERTNEIVLLVLQEWIYATQVWVRLVPSKHVTNLFLLIARIGCSQISTTLGWKKTRLGGKLIFMIECWHLWGWHNKSIGTFGDSRNQTVRHSSFKNTIMISKSVILIIFVINIGVKRQSTSVRSSLQGYWLVRRVQLSSSDTNNKYNNGYIVTIGVCDTLHTKTWGMYLIIKFA